VNIGSIWAIQRRGIGRIGEEQVAGLDAREMPAIGIDQEFLAIGRHREAEVIGDGFVHVEPVSPAKCRSQVHAFGPIFGVGTTGRIGAHLG
jgi:hypothetical protein